MLFDKAVWKEIGKDKSKIFPFFLAYVLPLSILIVFLGKFLVPTIWGAMSVRNQESMPATTGHIPDGYHLVFEDTFDQESLDTTKWLMLYGDGAERGMGINALSSVQLPGDGYLHLLTEYVDEQLLTSQIRTRNEFQYGYFEARIKFQTLRGHHGAFWLQSSHYNDAVNNPGLSGAEIDIIEFFGNERPTHDTEHNVYWNGEGGRKDDDHPTQEIRYYDQFGTGRI